MEKLDYGELEKEVINLIGQHKTIVLATCSSNRVTARTMSIVHDGLLIYFQTDRTSLKFRQALANPHVALCVDNMQIEGIAVAKGHPLDDSLFVNLYKERHPGSFGRYSHLKSNVLIEVAPCLVTLWKYNPDPFRDCLNVTEKLAYREPYIAE